MENTVTVTIDGITVKVKPTATILEAAKAAGAAVPGEVPVAAADVVADEE